MVNKFCSTKTLSLFSPSLPSAYLAILHLIAGPRAPPHGPGQLPARLRGGAAPPGRHGQPRRAHRARFLRARLRSAPQRAPHRGQRQQGRPGACLREDVAGVSVSQTLKCIRENRMCVTFIESYINVFSISV